ncbi:MAG: transposase [Xanthomonadaceae bacterium]|nr:transposase [Xanthomonadaceae bacterium]
MSRRRYTDDFKAQAIALAESIGPASAARQLNISVKTLSNWLTASRADQLHPYHLVMVGRMRAY